MSVLPYLTFPIDITNEENDKRLYNLNFYRPNINIYFFNNCFFLAITEGTK